MPLKLNSLAEKQNRRTEREHSVSTNRGKQAPSPGAAIPQGLGSYWKQLPQNQWEAEHKANSKWRKHILNVNTTLLFAWKSTKPAREHQQYSTKPRAGGSILWNLVP